MEVAGETETDRQRHGGRTHAFVTAPRGGSCGDHGGMSFTKYSSLEVTWAWASARPALLGSLRPRVTAEGWVMLAVWGEEA